MTSINFTQLEKAAIPSAEFVRAAVTFYGADRILWGSDFGNSQGTYAELVAKGIASTAKLNSAEKQAVLHNTGRRVYGRT